MADDVPPPSPLVRDDDPGGAASYQRLVLGLPSETWRGVLDDSVRLALDAPASPDARPWRALGPRNLGGRIRDLVQDPVHPRTLYAGSAFGGVWRTRDAGISWEPLGGPEHALPVGALGVSADGRFLYVGTGEPVPSKPPGRGVFRFDLADDPVSVDPRLAGTPPAGGPAAAGEAPRYSRIRVDPRDAGRFWIASNRGVFRHEDGDFHREGDEDHGDVTDLLLDASDAGTYRVYYAVRGDGLYVVDHAPGGASGAPRRLRGLNGRIRLALCASDPRHLYALDTDDRDFARAVQHSDDFGDSWSSGAALPRAQGEGKRGFGQADYDLVVEVHPDHPNLVVAGTVDLYRSHDHGGTWVRILDWTEERESPGQHADQHAVVFDRRDPPASNRSRDLWVGNDGGVSYSPDLGESWEKRSWGIIAAQFNDVTAHPRHPHILAGGLQDNGTFIGYGGKSWYSILGGDGGMVAFDPGDVRRIYATTQTGVKRLVVGSGYSAAVLGDRGPGGALQLVQTELDGGIDDDFKALFVGVVEHHPTTSDHILIGRRGRGFVGTVPAPGSPLAFQRLRFDVDSSVEVSAVAYDPQRADTHWWAGTSDGRVFRTTDGNGSDWLAQAIPNLEPAGDEKRRHVTRIGVHPDSSDIAVVTVASRPPDDDGGPADPGRVFLTVDDGGNWIDVTGRAPATVAPRPLPPSPITAAALHPAEPLLLVGTVAGVWVLETLPFVADAGATPEWRTFNEGLPLILVTDLAFVGEDRVRCSTYGRGMFEADLDPPAAPPAARLFIRQFATEEGLVYPRDDPALGLAGLGGDPRVTNDPDSYDLDRNVTRRFRAFDLRVQAPPLLGERFIDGAEFDSVMVSDDPLPGVTNEVFVQINNEGTPAEGPERVLVDLYVCRNASPLPDLQATFWADFPGDPFPDGTWRRLGRRALEVPPRSSRVVRFTWVPTADDLGENGLMAVCTSDPGGANRDAITTVETDIEALVDAERRLAIRVVEVVPDLYLRDAPDDTGTPGAVAWGGRSPDIILWHPANAGDPVPDPAVAFPDPGDPDPGEALDAGPQQIFVRVHNGSPVTVTGATVEVFATTLEDWRNWPDAANRVTPAGGIPVADLPADGFAFSDPVAWDPAGDEDHIVVAFLSHPRDIGFRPASGSILEFWKGFLGESRTSRFENNIALRVVRFSS